MLALLICMLVEQLWKSLDRVQNIRRCSTKIKIMNIMLMVVNIRSEFSINTWKVDVVLVKVGTHEKVLHSRFKLDLYLFPDGGCARRKIVLRIIGFGFSVGRILVSNGTGCIYFFCKIASQYNETKDQITHNCFSLDIEFR